MESFFLQVLGLPIHPLVVHAALVLIPVAALAIALGVIFYRRAPVLLGYSVVLTWLAALSAFIATQSGEALAEEIGITQTHEQWGELAGPVTIAAAVVVTATWWVRKKGWRLASTIGTLASLAAAPILVVIVFLAGHSGAEATWGNVLAGSAGPVADEPTAVMPTPNELPSPTTTDPVSEASTFTLDDVAQHATIEDCWIVVDGVVYDASGYANAHPGGASRIADICGTDATQAFLGQHGEQGAPNRTLAGFEIGQLAN